MKRIALLAALLALGLAAFAYSQSIPRATAGMRLAWDQSAESLADAQAYRFTAYVNGATTGAVVTATCSGAASPFECVTPLPATSIGTHTVVIAAQTVFDDGLFSDEARSAAFSFRVVEPASAPGRLRLFR